MLGLLQHLSALDLHTNVVDNAAVGTVFEDLICKFAELSNETASEHFTLCEVSRLMVPCYSSRATRRCKDSATFAGSTTAGTVKMLSVAGEHLQASSLGAADAVLAAAERLQAVKKPPTVTADQGNAVPKCSVRRGSIGVPRAAVGGHDGGGARQQTGWRHVRCLDSGHEGDVHAAHAHQVVRQGVPEQHGARLDDAADVEAVQPAPSQLGVGALDRGAVLDVQRLGEVAGYERAPLSLSRRVGGLGGECVDVGVAAARRWQHGLGTACSQLVDGLQLGEAAIGQTVVGRDSAAGAWRASGSSGPCRCRCR